ncbi:phage tail protein, partial [Cytobacillus firmus]|nr:phage tail protein [Cytobacillus firmus]
MGVFGGLIMTSRGRNLQVKAQTGVKLTFTRMAIGDGSLGSSSILELNALKNERKSLNLTKLKPSTGGMALIGAVLSNQDITAGFYFREIGIFATDPDIGEILYCYGNAGSTADYIPAGSGGSTDLIEKTININVIVGNAANVSATIDQSLVFETPQGAQEKANTAETNAKTYTDNQIASIDLSPLATKEELATESQARVAHQAEDAI